MIINGFGEIFHIFIQAFQISTGKFEIVSQLNVLLALILGDTFLKQLRPGVNNRLLWSAPGTHRPKRQLKCIKILIIDICSSVENKEFLVGKCVFHFVEFQQMFIPSV